MALSVNTFFPSVNFDFLYNITRNWTVYFSANKNWDPRAAMQGATKEIKMVIFV